MQNLYTTCHVSITITTLLNTTGHMGVPSDSLELTAEFDGVGVLHYVVLAVGGAAPKDGEVLTAMTTAAAAGSVAVEDKNKPGFVTVSGLTAGTSYEVFMVSETTDSGGVYGTVSRKVAVATHATPPSLTGVSATAKPGSATAMVLKFQAAAAAQVHYLFVPQVANSNSNPNSISNPPQCGTDIVAACAEGNGNGDGNGDETENGGAVAVCGTVQIVSPNIAQTQNVEALLADTAYDIYVVAETIDSRGVFGDLLAPKLSASTFALAPAFAPASTRAAPSDASSMSISLDFEMESAGVVHYVVLVSE